jgi:3-hydroxyacyl-CoA dehydrogenase
MQSVIQKMNSQPSEREQQKNKLIGRPEVGGTLDFADIITGDTFHHAYKSRQAGTVSNYRKSSSKVGRNQSGEELRHIWQTQI